MEGEDGKGSEAEQQRSFRAQPHDAQSNFQAKSPWRRLAIILAGPAANFLLCYAILLIGALAFGVASDKTSQPVVRRSDPGSPAQIGGLRPGDRIVAINGVPMTTGKKLVDTIHGALRKRLDLVYQRNGIRPKIYVLPRACPAASRAEPWLHRILPRSGLRTRWIRCRGTPKRRAVRRNRRRNGRRDRAPRDAVFKVFAASLRADRHGPGGGDGAGLGLGTVS
jgi:membrane-associated protease RseP (regulator of RpoE activity)